jgi:hypothetical protein
MITEYGWFYITANGAKVEHFSNYPRKDETEVRRDVMAILMHDLTNPKDQVPQFNPYTRRVIE